MMTTPQMAKYLVLALLVTGHTVGTFQLPTMCVGAQLAVVMATSAKLTAQERSTPPGEWCQRPTTRMSNKAHPCACHQHDCTDEDPDHLSAHTDSACLNYCNVKDCRCAVMDCK